MKVFAATISTETNTFSPAPTGAADFDTHRSQVVADVDGAAIAALRRRTLSRGWEFTFALQASAQPAGVTVRSAYEDLREEVLDSLRSQLPVDMVLLPLHGAMVAEGYDDCEGDLVSRVRDVVGPDVPIGVELDLHCHLTQTLLDAADAVVIFKEYPHTDMADRAEDLFDIIADAAEGKVRPTMAMFDCRMIGMYLSPFQPVRAFVDDMMEAESSARSTREAGGRDTLLSLSLAHGFPWGDVPDLGCRMLAVTDGDPEGAAALAEQWGRRFHALRREVTLEPVGMQEALDRALAADSGPVVVADQADNPGGGAPSDSTFVLRELLERGAQGVALAMMWDPIVVHTAMAGGVGARLKLRLGGKMGPASGDPLDVEAEVLAVRPGHTQTWPQTDGELIIDCGDAVALRIGGVDVVVNTKRGQVLSPTVFSNIGLDPLSYRVLVVKSTQHFYAGFAPIASEVIYMGAPGAIAPIMTSIPLQRADLNKYPWVESPFGE